MTKRRVALLYDAIYPFVKGGAERRFHELGKRLVDDNTEVHLYGMKLWDGPKDIELEGMFLHGIAKARPLYTKSGRRSIAQALLFGLSAFKLLRANFDIIDCCGFPYFSLFPAKLAAAIKHKPLHATWHEVWGRAYWNEYLGPAGLLGFAVEWLAVKMPDTIITTSTHTAGKLKSTFHVRQPVKVVPNGVNCQSIKEVEPAKKPSDVIYVGRIVDFKNINLIIDALAYLKTRGEALRCKIIGDGPAKPKLQKLAANLGVQSQIDWLGFLDSSDEVYSHMHAAKVFVLPSAREGFGIVVLESNACGTPVVTASYAGNAAKDLVEPDANGYVFEPNVDELADALHRVLANTQKLTRDAARFAQSYDWWKMTNQIAQVYAT